MKRLKKLKSHLNELYGDYDFSELYGILERLPDEDKNNTDWYKHFNLYVTYPDSFQKDRKRNFSTLKDQLKRIKSSGFTGIHVLPFLDSPLVDAGFDVRNYEKIRSDLGSEEDFDEFLREAKKLKIKVFMDMILNHVSYQHTWFQQAVKGNEDYREFFYAFKEKPTLLGKSQDTSGHFVKYKLGKRIIDIRLIFPELSSSLPNFYKGDDGYYYFHTFYPEQIDLNWSNPKVFIELSKILIYWAKKGVSFRLDAIPFIGKNFKLEIFESSPSAHKIIQALNIIITGINPDAVFLSESYQPIEKVMHYFGDNKNSESKLAYDFKMMNVLWEVLITRNFGKLKEYLQLKKTFTLPEDAQWVTLLRNHDELSLEYADENARKIILKELTPKGMDFKKGYGISGRTASFLGDKRLISAYALLCSLPGCPALIYGDEIGKKNDIENLKKLQKRKEETIGKIIVDSRDINRGVIESGDLNMEKNIKLQKAISDIFNLRLKFPEMYTLDPIVENTLDNSIHLKYELQDKKELHCIMNLSDEILELNFDYSKVLLKVNDVKIDGNNIYLSKDSVIWILC